MELNEKRVYKTALLIFIFIYIVFFPFTNTTNKIDALMVLFFSLLFVYKTRRSIPVMLISLFILYVNYSVVMGEFFFQELYGCPFLEVKNTNNYGVAIRSLLIFILTQGLFYVSREYCFFLNSKKNFVMYVFFYILIVCGVIYGIDRSVERNFYSAAINPIYEYAKTLLLFLYLYAGDSKKYKYMILPLMVIMILQDAYYGGRITSIQIMMLFLITFGIREYNINIKKLIALVAIGLLATNLVAVYRISYSFLGINIQAIVKKILASFLISDTANYSFYASATHIAGSYEVSPAIRLSSFLEFIASVFVGSGTFKKGNVTRFIADNYYFNLGGGVMPTHAFFWLGWFGVLSISIIINMLINKINEQKNILQWLIGAAVIVNVPRWYLYNPLILFRGSIFFILVVYFISKVMERTISLSLISSNVFPKPRNEEEMY